MISFIKGTVEDVLEDRVVVDNNGIGYSIFTSDVSEISPGQDIRMYTYLSVREDAMLLYGFLAKEDLNMFKLMLGVSGIGPKAAISILSTFSSDDLRIAIISNDSKFISKAPGIGKKTAERLIMEIGDKIGSIMSALPGSDAIYANSSVGKGITPPDEATEALISLGYSSAEAVKSVNAAIKLIGSDADTESILKAALKQLV